MDFFRFQTIKKEESIDNPIAPKQEDRKNSFSWIEDKIVVIKALLMIICGIEDKMPFFFDSICPISLFFQNLKKVYEEIPDKKSMNNNSDGKIKVE